MNRRESEIADRYKAMGWRPMKNGAPDFLMLIADANGDITSDELRKRVMAVEVKRKGARLTYEQKVYKMIFERAGIPFKVEVVP